MGGKPLVFQMEISTTQVEGDKWEMLGRDSRRQLRGNTATAPRLPKILGGAPLVFQMEILNINGPTVEPADKCDPATKKRLLSAKFPTSTSRRPSPRPTAPRSSSGSRT